LRSAKEKAARNHHRYQDKSHFQKDDRFAAKHWKRKPMGGMVFRFYLEGDISYGSNNIER
jgi:hypothetical protein